MCHAFTLDSSFFNFLQQIDDEQARQAQAAGCPHCGKVLHRAAYRRKPRGVDRTLLGEGYHWRHSFCCAADGCRRRCTPPSVRFLGRRVYLGLLVVLCSSASVGRVVALGQQLSVPIKTIRRWRQWWQQTFCTLPGWATGRLQLAAPIDAQRLPEALWERFGALTPATLTSLLRWIAPLPSACAHALSEG
jgi:hypothetical protein